MLKTMKFLFIMEVIAQELSFLLNVDDIYPDKINSDPALFYFQIF